jgi:pilus assembly protein CpaF
MNSGHDGSLSTGHANSSQDMLSRIETMILSSSTLPLEAVRKQIVSAIDIIVLLSRLRDKTRRTMEISEVLGIENNQIKLSPLFVFEETFQKNIKTSSTVIGCLKRSGNPLFNKHKLINSGIFELEDLA